MRRGGRDEDPPVREWLEEPPRGWGDDYGGQDVGAGGYGGQDVGAGTRGRGGGGGYGAGGYDAEDRYGSGGRRRAGYGLPADDPPTRYSAIERYAPPGYGVGEPGYGSGDYGVDPYGAADEPSRRLRPGEEYVPRRAANEPFGPAAIEAPHGPASKSGRGWGDEPPARQRPGAGGKVRRKRKQMPLWQEMPLLLIVAFCLAVLIRTFLAQAFSIPSGSMTDTLLIGDRVLVNKVVYDMRDPRRGEIVVFSGTDSWVPEVPAEPDLGFMDKLGRTVGDLVGVSRPGDKDFIKRVIGLPGDRVSCCDAKGRVQVNGQPLDEPYVIENSPLDAPPNPRECRSRRFEEVVIQPGQMWVMGDHRLVSQDARCQGPVPIKNIIGKAFVVVWPKESWATLPTPSTFDDVPSPGVVAAPAGGAAGALPEASTGIFGIVMPILLALGFPARTRREFLGDRRRLAE